MALSPTDNPTFLVIFEIQESNANQRVDVNFHALSICCRHYSPNRLGPLYNIHCLEAHPTRENISLLVSFPPSLIFLPTSATNEESAYDMLNNLAGSLDEESDHILGYAVPSAASPSLFECP